jgi:hypothetical protein
VRAQPTKPPAGPDRTALRPENLRSQHKDRHRKDEGGVGESLYAVRPDDPLVGRHETTIRLHELAALPGLVVGEVRVEAVDVCPEHGGEVRVDHRRVASGQGFDSGREVGGEGDLGEADFASDVTDLALVLCSGQLGDTTAT